MLELGAAKVFLRASGKAMGGWRRRASSLQRVNQHHLGAGLAEASALRHVGPYANGRAPWQTIAGPGNRETSFAGRC